MEPRLRQYEALFAAKILIHPQSLQSPMCETAGRCVNAVILQSLGVLLDLRIDRP